MPVVSNRVLTSNPAIFPNIGGCVKGILCSDLSPVGKRCIDFSSYPMCRGFINLKICHFKVFVENEYLKMVR